MTLYMVFVGLCIVVYTSVVHAESAVAILIAARRDAGGVRPPDALVEPRSGARAAATQAESAPVAAAGMQLFQERCSGCHRSDGNGVGPVLAGMFGRPVQDPSCGAQVVDEAYIREAILNPSATVAAGFPPVMPTFAGEVTEGDLQALVAYLKSMSAPQIQAR